MKTSSPSKIQMNRTRRVSLVAVALLCSALGTFGIENLQITVQCPNVVLSWSSKSGETYIVQYRPTLDASTPWVTLANNHPAAVGANLTTFTHADVIPDCPPPGAPEGGGAQATLSAEERAVRLDQLRKQAEASAEYLMALLREAIAKADAARERWAREGKPATQTAASQAQGNSPQGGESQTATSTGFYRVVRTGVNFFGISNGQVFSGIVSLPVEIGLASGIPMEVALAPIADNEEDTYPSGVQLYVLDENNRSPELLWDTHRTPNGVYTLKAAVTLQGDTVVAGAPVTVTVFNQIQMPKIAEVIVSGMPIYAIIDQPSANYTVTIRNAQGQIVRTLTGQAVNYVVNTFWNGLDDLGNNVLADRSYFDVTVSYNPSYTYRIWVFFEDDFLDGNWLIAYLKGVYSPVNEIQLDNAMQQMSDFAAEEGLAYAPYVQLRSGAPADWLTMTNVLKMPDTRNFYYWGHGGPSALGFGNNDPNNGVTARQMRAALGNDVVGNEIQIWHAFRFVWLDGCQTGTKSSAWPQAFGIQPVQLDPADFTAMGAAERAFLGWKKKIVTQSFDTSRFTFAENFFENWISAGDLLSDALDAAAIGTVGTSERNKLQIWGNPQLARQGPFQ